MSNVLAKYNEIGKQRDVIFFLKSILKKQQISQTDVSLLCLHAPGNMKLRPDVMLGFFEFIEIVEVDHENEIISLNDKGLLLHKENDERLIVRTMIEYTLYKAFVNGILSSDHFKFDVYNNIFIFKPEKLSLSFSSIRNILIEFRFFEQRIDDYEGRYKTTLEVRPEYEFLLTNRIKEQKRNLSLERLKEQLIKNEEVGDRAEKFVLDYERKRLSLHANLERIKQVSLVDVTAGYDIISFDSIESREYDRYIEVKAITNNYGFYWSVNEIETAKVKRERYYLYLVEVSKISDLGYEPYIIVDPFIHLTNSDEWLFEAQSYYVQRV